MSQNHKGKRRRRKRGAGGKRYDIYHGLGLDEIEDPRHPDQSNKWYSEMSATTKQATNESCYVCSLIPHASGTPKILVPQEVPLQDAQCLIHLVLCRIRNTFQAHTVTIEMLENEKTCTSKRQGVICIKEPFFVIKGTRFTDNKWHAEKIECKAEALRGLTEETFQWVKDTCASIWSQHIGKLTWVTALEKPIKRQKEISHELCFHGEGKVQMGTNKQCNKTIIIPDMKKGTAALMDMYWVCGKQAYLHLPASWRGTCGLATLHSALMVIPESNIQRKGESAGTSAAGQSASTPAAPQPTPTELYAYNIISVNDLKERLSHRKRSNYISTESSKLLAEIPTEYKLFNTAETFFASLLTSGLQARTNAKWLQIVRWELIQLANDTDEGFNVIKVELRALRLMTMQNWYVLDLLTAMDGGVCRKIGSACCTFVPSEDADNGTLTHVISAVHSLGERMREEGGVEPSNWFDNMFNWIPSWFSIMMKIFVTVIVFILLFFCVCQLGIRCCAKSMPSSGMMMVTMGRQATVATMIDAQMQTGEPNPPKYRMTAVYRQNGDRVENLYHTTIKEPTELQWYR
ncbi:uncharacterized protein [Ambystoma mexicanum]|uniref:uncharacterized protein n=1 Tax=Ambystoma mexicanum TaxID=8296 RepID=UPI0037E74571